MKTDKDGFIQVLSYNIQKVLSQSRYVADIEKLDKAIEDKKYELKSLIKQLQGKLIRKYITKNMKGYLMSLMS